jgi:hypothetical protein
MARAKPKAVASESWGLTAEEVAAAWALNLPSIVILKQAAAPGGAIVGPSPLLSKLVAADFVAVVGRHVDRCRITITTIGLRACAFYLAGIVSLKDRGPVPVYWG